MPGVRVSEVPGPTTTVTTERLFLSGGSRSTASGSANNPSPEGIGSLTINSGAAVSTDYLESYERSTIFIDNASLTVGDAVMGSITGGILHEGSTLRIGLNSVPRKRPASDPLFVIAAFCYSGAHGNT